jgi:asparagine synthase (glutamine-hydrolysing)
MYRAGPPQDVLPVGLRERTARLQARYDYQFPSTYVVRRAVAPQLPGAFPVMALSGAGGELARGRWYPADDTHDGDEAAGRQAALSRFTSTVPAAAVSEDAAAVERERVDGMLGDAIELGVRGVALIDYLYLMEYERRWNTSAYTFGTVMPFLAPAFVAATFALSPADKRRRLVHDSLLERLVPEWAGIPFVSAGSSRSTATEVWDGDGATALCDLLDTADGRIAGLLRRDAVERALVACQAGKPSASRRRILQQFAYLAVASQTLEPGTVGASTGAARARVAAALSASPPVPRPLSAAASRLRFVKRSRLGRRLWNSVRARVVRRG